MEILISHHGSYSEFFSMGFTVEAHTGQALSCTSLSHEGLDFLKSKDGML